AAGRGVGPRGRGGRVRRAPPVTVKVRRRDAAVAAPAPRGRGGAPAPITDRTPPRLNGSSRETKTETERPSGVRAPRERRADAVRVRRWHPRIPGDVGGI